MPNWGSWVLGALIYTHRYSCMCQTLSSHCAGRSMCGVWSMLAQNSCKSSIPCTVPRGNFATRQKWLSPRRYLLPRTSYTIKYIGISRVVRRTPMNHDARTKVLCNSSGRWPIQLFQKQQLQQCRIPNLVSQTAKHSSQRPRRSNEKSAIPFTMPTR